MRRRDGYKREVDSGLGKDRAGVFLFKLLCLTRERWSM